MVTEWGGDGITGTIFVIQAEVVLTGGSVIGSPSVSIGWYGGW